MDKERTGSGPVPGFIYRVCLFLFHVSCLCVWLSLFLGYLNFPGFYGIIIYLWCDRCLSDF